MKIKIGNKVGVGEACPLIEMLWGRSAHWTNVHIATQGHRLSESLHTLTVFELSQHSHLARTVGSSMTGETHRAAHGIAFLWRGGV